MNTNELDRRRALLSLTGGLLLAAGVQAQPTTLQVIVGFPPGGPNDIAARAIQQRLAAVLGVNVVIENKAGASGELAARLVAKGPADGSTMLLGSGGALAISPLINAALPYDPAKELLAVHSVAVSPQIVLVGANSPYKSVAELVEAARRSPGRISYASAGGSSPTRLAAALIAHRAKVEMLHVPYRGGSPALVDLIAGQVDFYIGGAASAMPLVKQGRLRALAVTGSERTSIAPGIPTVPWPVTSPRLPASMRSPPHSSSRPSSSSMARASANAWPTRMSMPMTDTASSRSAWTPLRSRSRTSSTRADWSRPGTAPLDSPTMAVGGCWGSRRAPTPRP